MHNGNKISKLNKFGKRFLATTAITAVGLIPFSGTSQAANDWTDHVATSGGSLNIDTSVPNTTNIEQIGDTVSVSGDGDLKAGWTVNVAQPSTSSKYILFDIENDPTFIRGKLNANGEIWIFDQNGVIFGADSQVNVGSIVASTAGFASTTTNGDDVTTVFTNFGDSEIINRGEITVAEAGVAAFVAPTIKNNGVINAKLGNVVMASGQTVTLDMYGDGLVEVAVDGELADGLIKNTGTIEARGGNVQISAAIAKDAVDNVINMSGVVNVSSAEVKGGKIVLSGGESGRVKVAGDVRANGTSGQDAGSVEITGENITVTNDGDIRARSIFEGTGNAGDIKIVAGDTLRINGDVSALGLDETGFIETSAPNTVFGSNASVLATREWLLDPTDITIDEPLSLLIEDQLAVGDMTVMTPAGGTDEGDIGVRAIVDWSTDKTFKLVAADDVFLSSIGGGINATDAGNFVVEAGDDFRMNAGNNSINTNGGNVTITTGDEVTIDDGVINANGGNILIDNAEQFQAVADSLQTSGTGTITLNQNKDANGYTSTTDATIQNAVDAISNTGTGLNTVKVGAGTWNESTTIDKAINIEGVNRNTTFIAPGAGQNGFTIDGVIDGVVRILRMDISGGSAGVRVNDTADVNAVVVGGTRMTNNELHGLAVYGDSVKRTRVINSIFTNNGAAGGSAGEGDIMFYLHNGDILLRNVDIQNNSPANTADYGIQIRGANGLAPAGTIEFDNVNVAGNYRAALVGIQEYSAIDSLSMNDVTLGGQTDNGTDSSGWGSLYLSNLGTNDIDLGNTTFDAVTGQYIVLGTDAASTFPAPPTYVTTNNIDATDATFEGIAAADLTVEQSFDVEDKIFHKIDFAPQGLVTWQEGNVFVTGTSGSIQRGIDASEAGETVHVDDSTFTEDLIIDKALKLTGHGTTLHSNGADNLITMTASDVNIDPFTFDGLGLASYGVKATNSNNLVIDGNSFTGFVLANIDVEDSSRVRIKNNTMTGAEKGVHGDSAKDIHVFDNDISGSTVAGIHIENSDGVGYGGGQNDIDIWSNTIASADGTGIWVQNSDYASIGDHPTNPFESGYGGANTISGGDDAIVVEDSENVWVSHNIINNVDGEGVLLDNSDNYFINKNIISNTGDNGVKVTSSDDGDIQGNEISNAGFNGIAVLDSDNATISMANIIDGTFAAGISLNRTTNSLVDGNDISNTGGSGVWISKADASTVSNNEINTTWLNGSRSTGAGVHVVNTEDAAVSSNVIKNITRGGSGVEVINSDNANIDDNDIDNAANGVRATDSNDITISNNEIDDVTAAGISVTNGNDAQIISNEVNDNGASTYADYGILVDGGNSVDVDDNKIEETSIAGIVANNTTYIDIDDNLVKDGKDGIIVNGGHHADIRRNETRDMSDDGIQVLSHADVEIENNKVLRSDDSGITVYNSARAEVDGNDVDVAKNGIRVTSSANAKVTNNDVDDASDNAIWVVNSDDAQIISNEVNDNGASTYADYGILIDGGNSVDVDDNKIEETSIAGIAANNTTYIDIDDNLVKDGEKGIVVTNGYNADIRRNTIQDMNNDGIEVTSHDNVDIEGNIINRVDGHGIQVSNSNHANIVENNRIHDAGFDGINVSGGYGATITNNHIGDVEYDGIDVTSNAFVNALNNEIHNVGDNGIEVGDSFVAIINDNEITGAGNDGINVDSSAGAHIKRNNIYGQATASSFSYWGQSVMGAQRDGIHVEDSSSVIIDNNTIQGDSANFKKDGLGAGRHGIFVSGGNSYLFGNGVKVTNNNILGDGGFFHSSDSVGADGIHIEDNGAGFYGSAPLVSDNNIEKTGADGIDVDGTSNVDIMNNIVKSAGDNGIEASNSYDTDIRYNNIEGSEDNGIELSSSAYADIRNNIVRSSGDDGIDVDQSYKANVNGNIIFGAEDDGIDVSNSFDANIIGNHIRFVGDDGIYARGNFGADIRFNDIQFAGRDGIDVEDSNYVDVNFNKVGFTGGNGIEVQNSDNADIIGNAVFNAGENGIYVNPSDNVKVGFNAVLGSGENGIDINGGNDISVFRNLVGYNDNDGINVNHYSYSYYPNEINITGNEANDNGENGIRVYGAPYSSGVELLVDGNTTNDNGDNGINIIAETGFYSPEPREERFRVALVAPINEFNSTIVGNTSENNANNGLFVEGGGHDNVEVSDNTFTDNDTGATFESGIIDLTGEGNLFDGGRVGMRFAPAIIGYEYDEFEQEDTFSTLQFSAPSFFIEGEPVYADMSLVDNTIGSQTFDGQSDLYVELDNEAFFAPGSPTLLNALDSTYVGTPFGTVTPSSDFASGFTLEQAAFFESRFFHFNDNGNTGLFFFPLLPEIDQEDIFNYFGPNAASLSGLNLTLLGLPTIPGLTPVALNNITPAAGGEFDPNDPASLNAIETAAGGSNTSCWGDATSAASQGQAVNLSYGGSAEELLNGEASCGS